MTSSAAWAEVATDLDELECYRTELRAYGEKPVVGREPAEVWDRLSDRDGGHFRTRVHWTPRHEGYGPGLGTESDFPGQTRAQHPVHCTVCGGMLWCCDLATREEVFVPRSSVDPTIPALGDEDTCGGCLRQGPALARRVELAARLLRERYEREDELGDPYSPGGDPGGGPGGG